jgi:hypothetical protein
MSSSAASSSSVAPAAAASASSPAHWSDKLRAVDRLAPQHVKHNLEVVHFTRTWVSIVGGCCCGILGLTNWSGFLFYLLTSLLTSVVLLAKVGGVDPHSVKERFVGWGALTTDGLVAGCMSFVLFWTLLYDIVYVY